MRYTTDPPHLILPTEATIRHIARREGLGELTQVEWEFVWDLLAKTGGATVRPFDEIEAQAEAAAQAISEAEAFVRRTGYDQSSAIHRFERTYHLQQHQRYEALSSIDLNQIPGYNHPTKAVRLLKLFRNAQTIWIVFIVVQIADFVDLLNNALSRISNLEPDFLAILMAFSDGDNPLDDAVMLGLELELHNIQLTEMLRICRRLDQITDFVTPRAKPVPDPNGEETVVRDIQDLSELGRTVQSSYALPDRLRMARAVNGELGVREPRTRRDRKQLLFIVLDGTGSMLQDSALSASRAAGVVLNRLSAVTRGEAEVYLRFFDGALREHEYHANSVETAQELIRVVTDPTSYTGRRTDFVTTLDAASRRVQALMASQGFHDPELVFVTDGEADTPPLSVLHGVKMHVVQVGTEESRELSRLARTSGGVSIHTDVTW